MHNSNDTPKKKNYCAIQVCLRISDKLLLFNYDNSKNVNDKFLCVKPVILQ